ncbi:MAG: carbohydrate kinase family protein [Pyrinomonadaceae bacterium]|nr:carbohydrate kinase family protein [Pyrinomonadaceae bacterium]
MDALIASVSGLYRSSMNTSFLLPDNKPFDVVGFGTNAVDHLITVPEYPRYNSKIELTEHVQLAGGEVATTMCGLSRLGLRTAYAGRFGSDAEGRIGIDSLAEDGVATKWAEIVDGARTQIAYILVDEKAGERTVIWKRDARLSYSAADAPIAAAEQCRILHITPHDVEAAIAMASAARASGALVSIDVDSIFPEMDKLLRLVDIFTGSADLPANLTGEPDLESALRMISDEYSCQLTGATLGAGGSLHYFEGEFIRAGGFAVPGGCKDTTGAGDAFRAGLLYGIVTGRDLETSAQMANAVGALKCRAIGARTALPRKEELMSLIERSA